MTEKEEGKYLDKYILNSLRAEFSHTKYLSAIPHHKFRSTSTPASYSRHQTNFNLHLNSSPGWLNLVVAFVHSFSLTYTSVVLRALRM